MTERFRRTPKKSQLLDVTMDDGIFVLEQQSKLGCRFMVELPGAPHPLRIELVRGTWRILSQTVRFANRGKLAMSIAVRYVELATFPASNAATVGFSEADLVARFHADYALGARAIDIQVETGTLQEFKRLIEDAATLHDQRVGIAARTPLSDFMKIQAVSRGANWRDMPRSAAIVRLLEAISEIYRPFGQNVYATTQGTAHRDHALIYALPREAATGHEEVAAIARINAFIENAPAKIKADYRLDDTLIDQIIAER